MSAIMTRELSIQACNYLQKRKNKAAQKYRITVDRLFRKLNDELEAFETKVFNDKETGIVYSKNLIAWKVRQEARRDAEAHLGIKPAEKQEIEHKGNVTFLVQDYASKRKKKGNGSAE